MSSKILIAGFLLVAIARSARAADVTATTAPAPSAAEVRPWAINAEMNFSFDSVPAYATLGVGVERHFGSFLVLDASLANGLSSAVATKTDEVRLDPWLDLAARARVQAPLDSRGVHSLFLGAGPRYSVGGAYGTLWHGQIEVGYSLHTLGGFSLLYAIGWQTPLADRSSSIDPSTCVVKGCAPTATAGDWATNYRIGLGYAF
jgi:hypothetical protein